jgi:hypothetical protein
LERVEGTTKQNLNISTPHVSSLGLKDLLETEDVKMPLQQNVRPDKRKKK